MNPRIKRILLVIGFTILWALVASPKRAYGDCPDNPTNGDFTALPSILLSEIQGLLPEQVTIFTLHPDFIDDTINPNILLDQPASVSVTFIDEGAGYRNAFGYVTYDNAGNVLCAHPIWLNVSVSGVSDSASDESNGRSASNPTA